MQMDLAARAMARVKQQEVALATTKKSLLKNKFRRPARKRPACNVGAGQPSVEQNACCSFCASTIHIAASHLHASQPTFLGVPRGGWQSQKSVSCFCLPGSLNRRCLCLLTSSANLYTKSGPASRTILTRPPKGKPFTCSTLTPAS